MVEKMPRLQVDGRAGGSCGKLVEALGELGAFSAGLDFALRDEQGWMEFKILSDHSDHGVSLDVMIVEFLFQSVAMNDEELSEEEFTKRIEKYAATVEMLGSRPALLIAAIESSQLSDCLKYFRILHDNGILWLEVPIRHGDDG